MSAEDVVYEASDCHVFSHPGGIYFRCLSPEQAQLAAKKLNEHAKLLRALKDARVYLTADDGDGMATMRKIEALIAEAEKAG